ncbi:MAG: hypothetical protein ABJQ39_12640 [Winogradskyella arenosi]|uniref:NlpE-like protein n=1 Tax=Winogradskyella arenosi TaxID=533325 RepID=A0A368ZIY8_9FLAO|nr:hypothetical protein [Winogradskyella arenosi]RCW93721.1 hypothetical protein DFQ08_101519 [Winogradskyella arenosi]
MRKISVIIVLTLVFFACKNEPKQEASSKDENPITKTTSEAYVTLKGDFVYYADAAVLQTPSEIYGVVIDEKMHQLNKQVTALKNEDTDMVPVTVKVRKFEKNKDEEGWQYRVEIKEILKVEAPDPEGKDVIKLAN